jgi:2-C-methyl-D-erythritol 4-phosphate cytidylyltransferase
VAGPTVVAAVVLAGGHGNRFGSPKYPVVLGGSRLIDRAVDLVRPYCRDIVLVLPPGHEWDGGAVSGVVSGGSTRTESLRRAMPLLARDVDVVVTHDCVRPLASGQQVRDAIDAVVAGADAAIPGWESPDAIKRLHPDGTVEDLGREKILVCHSPSAYRRSTLVRMFDELDDIPGDETFGVELIGGRVVAVAGDRWSQHVVDTRDIEMLQRLVRQDQDER